MKYSFDTDRSGHEWTDKDLKVLEQATRRDIETLEREMGMDPNAARTAGGHWWTWPYFEPSEKMVMEMAKRLRRPPGSIRAKMLQMSDEFFVDPIQFKKVDRVWQNISRATKREGPRAKASAWKQMGLRERVGNRL